MARASTDDKKVATVDLSDKEVANITRYLLDNHASDEDQRLRLTKAQWNQLIGEKDCTKAFVEGETKVDTFTAFVIEVV